MTETRLIVIRGNSGSGKTTLANAIRASYFASLSTNFIVTSFRIPPTMGR